MTAPVYAFPPVPREAFVPLRVADLVEWLGRDTGPTGDSALTDAELEQFHDFASSAIASTHDRYLTSLKRLERDYAPFDPDRELPLLDEPGEAERQKRLDDLFDQFAAMMERANFKRLSRPELELIMRGASDWGVDMHVPWDAYEKMDLYVRGQGLGRRTRRKWYRFFVQEEVTVPTFGRVVLILKQRPHKSLGKGADTQHAFIKLFKDIPTMDVEMLLPGTRIRMPLLDRLRLGGSGLGTLGYIIFKMQVMIAPLIKAVGLVTTGAVFGEQGIVGLIALYTPLALIGGYAYKTYASFNTTKRSYELQLSKSLYFQNLDNNAGVLYRLLDAAEEQEAREMLLAYFYLWKYGGTDGWTEAHLDAYVELELARRLQKEIDFDIGDAIRKLESSGLIVRYGDRLKAKPMGEARDAMRRAAAIARGEPA